MKKFLTVAIAVAMSAALALTSFASVTTWEDDRAVGLSVNDRESAGTDSEGFALYRAHSTNSHELDPDRATNFIIQEENGNRCVRIDTLEAWQTDYSFASEGQYYYSIDLKPTTLGIFQGIHLYQNPTIEESKDQYAVARLSDEYIQGCGMTLKSANTVVVYAILDNTITYTFDTGLDLTADWHTYSAYDCLNNGTIVFCIDNKVIATIDRNTNRILDADGNTVAESTGSFYTEEPYAGIAFTGEGMDILLDNLTLEPFDNAPTEKFVVATSAEETVEDAAETVTEDAAETTPAAQTADLAVIAIAALGAFAVAKKH